MALSPSDSCSRVLGIPHPEAATPSSTRSKTGCHERSNNQAYGFDRVQRTIGHWRQLGCSGPYSLFDAINFRRSAGGDAVAAVLMLDPELSPATGPSFRGQLMAQISSAPVIGIAIGAPGPAYGRADIRGGNIEFVRSNYVGGFTSELQGELGVPLPPACKNAARSAASASRAAARKWNYAATASSGVEWRATQDKTANSCVIEIAV
jgi:hypothetical protein